MLEEFFAQSENKTLEFKENTHPLLGIVKTIIAFANTAGGTLIIGVKDKTKEIVGLTNTLNEEERLANAIADNIAPLLVPDIEIHTYRERELIVIRVPHVAGSYYLKSEGKGKGVYIRFGSTNRKADLEMLSSLKLFADNLTYDELPLPKGNIDQNLIQEAFGWVKKQPTAKTYETLGIFSSRSGKLCPTIGGVLLFDSNRLNLLPDSIIRCARFGGITKERIIDQAEISVPLPFAIDEIISFIERNTYLESKFGRLVREDIPEYPPFAIREMVTNAVLHADYSMKGCHIQIAIFDDRIETTNPGCLPLGQTLKKAKSGFSRLRNRVLGLVFRELKLIEQWGSGLQRILAVCEQQGLRPPEFEEFHNQFRVTIFSGRVTETIMQPWEEILVVYLRNAKIVTSAEAAKIWNLSVRGARDRLKIMVSRGLLHRISTSEKDPKTTFVLKEQ